MPYPQNANRPEAGPPPYGSVLVSPAANPETRLRVQEFYLGGITNNTGQGCGAERLGRMEAMRTLPVSLEIAEGLSAPLEPGSRARSEGGLRFSGQGTCPPPASHLPGRTEPSPEAQTGRAAGRVGCGPIRPGTPKASAPSTSSFRGSPRA